MHWRFSVTYTASMSIRTCLWCGARGMLPRCAGTTLEGLRCKRWVLPPETVCDLHTPAAVRERAARRSKRGSR